MRQIYVLIGGKPAGWGWWQVMVVFLFESCCGLVGKSFLVINYVL